MKCILFELILTKFEVNFIYQLSSTILISVSNYTSYNYTNSFDFKFPYFTYPPPFKHPIGQAIISTYRYLQLLLFNY